MTIELVGGPCDGRRVDDVPPDTLFFEKARSVAGGDFYDYRRDEMPTQDGVVKFVYCGTVKEKR